MNFNLKQLEAFVWVADLSSFRKAAERLNTTQPNISSRISSLETVLDVVLLERSTGSVRVTAKGQELLNHARDVLQATRQLREAADRASLYDGVLKLGVTELIVHTWLRNYLKMLKESFPEVLVELTIDLSVNLTAGLDARSLDLALQSGPFAEPVSGSQSLGRYPWIWVASPSMLEGKAPPVWNVAELARFPILTHARTTGPYQQVKDHFSGVRGLRLVPSSNLAACLQMTVDNMGIAVMPQAMVVDELDTGQLLNIDYGWAPPDLVFEARYKQDHVSAIVQKAALLAGEVAANY